jgi:hypothetical protein
LSPWTTEWSVVQAARPVESARGPGSACDVDDATWLDEQPEVRGEAVAVFDDMDEAVREEQPGAPMEVRDEDASPFYTELIEESAVEGASFDITDQADPAMDGGTCCFQCGNQLYKNHIPGACQKYAKWVCDVKNKPFKSANWC